MDKPLCRDWPLPPVTSVLESAARERLNPIHYRRKVIIGPTSNFLDPGVLVATCGQVIGYRAHLLRPGKQIVAEQVAKILALN